MMKGRQIAAEIERVALRTSVTTIESVCCRAPCGDVTRGDGIADVALRQYAARIESGGAVVLTLAQLSPPSLVFRIFACWPTAYPVVASAMKIPTSEAVVPLFCELQVRPPSVVARIEPVEPTTKPRDALTKCRPLSEPL